MIKPENLINWSALSVALGYAKKSVTPSRIPKRVAHKVEELISLNQKYLDNIEKSKNNA